MNYITSIILITFLNVTAMTKEIRTDIIIHAKPEKIWKILSNFEDYPNWNPFIKSIHGEMKVGANIIVKIEPPQSKAMTFKPKIQHFEEGKAFSWLGHVFFKGLFDGQHSFEIIDNGDGSCTFKQSEIFSGILLAFFNTQNTENGFKAMNEKLKELAEKE